MSPADLTTDPAFTGIRAWVHDTLGIVFADDKLDSLHRRLDDVLRVSEVSDLATLHRALLDPSRSEVQVRVSQAMTTNHTAFFRENDAIEAFFADLPTSPPNDPLRVWSAACSTGEEPYSLAMRAIESIGARAESAIAILATDISQRALQSATVGRYSARAMAGVSEERQAQFFTPEGDGVFEIAPRVKRLCTFRRLNLAVAAWPFKRQFHAIYCRNVLYYFDKGLRQRIGRRLFEHVVPGGYLYTSVTEALRGLDTPWAYVRPGVYKKDRP